MKERLVTMDIYLLISRYARDLTKFISNHTSCIFNNSCCCFNLYDLKIMTEIDKNIRNGGEKEDLLLEATEEGIFSEELKKMKENDCVVLVCKWCEQRDEKDSIFWIDVKKMKEYFPDVKAWEAYTIKKCPRCNYPEGFKFV